MRESTRDGGPEDAIRSFSGCGHPHTHLPDRPWLNKLLQVIGRTPLGREKGDRKDRRKHTGKGRPSRCAPGPGWQKGAGRSRLGSGNVTPPDRKLSSASFPGPSAPSSAPRRRGWLGAVAERGLGSLWQLLHPGATRAPGCSSWSREFERGGSPRFEPSPVVVRSVLKALLEGMWVRSWAGGRKRCCPLCRDRDITGAASGSAPCLPPAAPTRAWRPSLSAPLPRLPRRRSVGLDHHDEKDKAGGWQVRRVTGAYRGSPPSWTLGGDPRRRRGA